MCADTRAGRVVLRHGSFNSHPRLATSLCLCLWAILVVAALSARSWIGVTGISIVAVLLYVSLAYLGFEIWDSGFSYRNLSGNHVFEFVRMEDALFETVCVGDGCAPVFSVRLKGEVRRNEVPIGLFGVQAGALLLTALESYGIPIRQDGSRLVESSMQQIREAQSSEAQHHLSGA